VNCFALSRMPSSAPSDPLWEISVVALPETEEAVTEILADLFGKPVSSYSDFETGRITVSVYFEGKDAPRPEQKLALKDVLSRIETQEAGISFSLRRIRNRDWAHSWKLHFKPIEIGTRLLIKPSWSRKRAKPGQKVVVLDPGLSFGTGQHPTTLFCLRQVATMSRRPGQLSFLDIGTGSGILAISAAKLGYSPVDAFDYDAKAVEVARQNAKRNQVLHKINLREQDVTTLSRQIRNRYSVICANLLANLLIQERDRIVSRLELQGGLAIAGILEKEFAEVARTYEKAGMKLVSARTQGEWRSGFFLKEFE